VKFYQVLSFLKYYLLKVNQHSLHNPLIYDLYTKLIKPLKNTPGITSIEDIRKELIHNNREISFSDYGAKGTSEKRSRKINEISKSSLSSPWKSMILLSMGKYFNAKNIYELGTSLGLNTLYLSSISESKVTTYEGGEEIANIAQDNFSRLHRNNIRIIIGDLHETLAPSINTINKVDLVFFDANHRYQPTLEYFNLFRNKIHEKTIFVFDDIHWSKEMSQAWEEIKKSVEVTLSIDLYYFGIVLFDPTLTKQHYILSS